MGSSSQVGPSEMYPGLDHLLDAEYPWERRGTLGRGDLFDHRQVQGEILAVNSQQPTLWGAVERVLGWTSGQREGGD